jgi:putative DNA modification/repair radical SAM protein
MIDNNKLQILTNGAKYDVSCSSSGSGRKNTGGLGNASISGICHSFTQDGRCISLLKILMTNNCIYDCLYCVNRRSNDIPRATATPDEICELVINFYKRNYIEGLFLSSAVEHSPNRTMELLTATVIKLRKVYAFNGYIHLKGIPNADQDLVMEAARYADRMSYNIELPSEQSLKLLAPQKSKEALLTPMNYLNNKHNDSTGSKYTKKFLPAGQTTQMIVGASPESDSSIVKLSEWLYRKYSLKRVYYSSYVPANFNTSLLPAKPTGLLREHRLYQADWLLRFYGFTSSELLNDGENFDEGYDPKCSWAIKNIHLFPIEINTASFEMLLRIPGVGLKSANRILIARKHTKLQYEHLLKMRIVLKRAIHFITADGKYFGNKNQALIKNTLLLTSQNEINKQLSLFSNNEISCSVLTGEL